MVRKTQHIRKDRLIKQKRQDVYEATDKWPESTLCIKCGALFSNGRWTWNQPKDKTNPITCPACRRIEDNYPAGHIEIKGPFFTEHHNEILNLIYNVEKQEKGERPLERIMNIADSGDHTTVTTTGIHIARRVGEALYRSYKGEFTFQYGEGEKNIRVYWQR